MRAGRQAARCAVPCAAPSRFPDVSSGGRSIASMPRSHPMGPPPYPGAAGGSRILANPQAVAFFTTTVSVHK